MFKYDKRTLSDLVLETKDGDWGRDCPSDGFQAYNVIRGADFPAARRGDISGVPLRYLSEQTVQRRTLQPNDILIETAGGSRDRSTGRTLFVSESLLDRLDGPTTCASFARFIRIDRAKADPHFVYWYLQLLHTSGGMWEHQVQHTGVARFQYTRFASTQAIPLPNRPDQEAISGILDALDDKVDLNAQIVRACDELRAVRFGRWLQEYSESAEGRPLSSMAEFVNGRAFTKDASGTGRMVIRIAEINSGPGGSTVYNNIDVSDTHLARPGDVLFAWSGSLAVARWFRAEGIINQHIFKVIPRVGIPSWLVFEQIKSKLAMFKGIAADKATTMGHIQRHHLDELVACPASEYITDLDAALGALWDRALLAEQESLKLAELRDMLLPKLMSGEIRVRDAEKVVEEVT